MRRGSSGRRRWRRAVHRLEHRRGTAFGIDVRGGSEPETALNRRAYIGQDVAEKVRGDDHIEALRCHHHPGAHRVDVDTRDLNIRVLGGDRFGHLGLPPIKWRAFLID